MTDWSSFLPTLVATFVGFALALTAQIIFENVKKSKEKKEITESLKEEIVYIKEQIRILNHSQLHLTPIKTTFWDGAINANKLMLIFKYEWFSDMQEIYSEIKDFNQWHTIKTEKTLEGTTHLQISKDMKSEHAKKEIDEAHISQILRLIKKLGEDICTTQIPRVIFINPKRHYSPKKLA